MQQKQVNLADGRSVTFELGDYAQDDAYFVLGLRKCGSSIMNSMVHDLARLNGRSFVDVGGRFFAANITEQDWRHDPAVLSALAPGNVYGGFRAMPLVMTQSGLYRRSRKILLVRDPRDALVSEYFSIAFSHGLPEGAPEEGSAREEFLALRQAALTKRLETMVLERAGLLNAAFLEYAAVVQDPLARIYRYEDVILQKRPWLRAIAAHFGWNPGSDAFIEGMMSWADVIPGEERSHDFIRKVVPGDHRNKLSPEAIEKLNVIVGPSMKLFGYT
jgi:hypothetical protein